MDTSQFGGDRANRERLVETSTVAFQAVGDCRAPGGRRRQRAGARRRLRALAALRPAGRLASRARFGYPELPRGIPPSYAAARAVLPATVAQELCLTGRVVDGAGGAAARDRPRGRHRATCVERAVALAERIAALPRQAILETKRRTLLERHHLWGFLFDEEERVFRRALLGETEPRPTATPLRLPASQAYGETAARMWGQT